MRPSIIWRSMDSRRPPATPSTPPATGEGRARVQSLAELIAAQNGPFTAAELVAEAQARRLRIRRATIFRTLDVLADLHAVERLDLPSGEHAYVACEPVITTT